MGLLSAFVSAGALAELDSPPQCSAGPDREWVQTQLRAELRRMEARVVEIANDGALLAMRSVWPRDEPLRASVRLSQLPWANGPVTLELLDCGNAPLDRTPLGRCGLVNLGNGEFRDRTFVVPPHCIHDGTVHLRWRLSVRDCLDDGTFRETTIERPIELAIEFVDSIDDATSPHLEPEVWRAVDLQLLVHPRHPEWGSTPLMVRFPRLPSPETAVGVRLMLFSDGDLVTEAAFFLDSLEYDDQRLRHFVLLIFPPISRELLSGDLSAVLVAEPRQALRDGLRSRHLAGGAVLRVEKLALE